MLDLFYSHKFIDTKRPIKTPFSLPWTRDIILDQAKKETIIAVMFFSLFLVSYLYSCGCVLIISNLLRLTRTQVKDNLWTLAASGWLEGVNNSFIHFLTHLLFYTPYILEENWLEIEVSKAA